MQFDASGTGISLDTNKTYWVVVDTSVYAGSGAGIRATASNDEDSGGAAGWTIANNRLQRNNTSNQWGTETATDSVKIEVIGSVNPPPPLVSNTGQTGTTDGSVSLDHAQAFTTGTNSTGYKLTQVQVDFSVDSGSQAGYAMEIWSDSSGSPGSKLHTLNKPASLSAGINNFDASGTGIDLDAGTTYHVVWNVSASGGAAKIRYTTSDNEDAGKAAGWSIADNSRHRAYQTTGGWTNFQQSLKIAIVGSAEETTKPTLGSAVVNGTSLKLNYSEALDTGSVPATTDFTVSVAGTDQTPTRVAVSGQTVTLTLGTAATAGQAVTVTYTVPATNPIEDLVGNDAAAISNRAVTNVTGDTTLVKNTGQGTASVSASFDKDSAQAFTTGGNSSGYMLTRVKMYMAATSSQPTYTVAIHADSSGAPAATSLGTLTRPTILPNTHTLLEFYASGTGIRLDANKMYWVVVDVSSYTGSGDGIRVTGSDSEDSGGPAGWTIANNRLQRNNTETNWGTDTPADAVKIDVIGSANPPPPPPPDTAPKLVSNTGQTAAGGQDLGSDYAQGFSTGSNAGGYKLTGVEFYFRRGSSQVPQPTYSVYIARDSSGAPGATLGTLTTSTSLSTSWASPVKLTATGGGIDLRADSTYWVVLDSKASNNGSQIRLTTSASEDTGGAAGWSLADDALARSYYETTWVDLEVNQVNYYPCSPSMVIQFWRCP